MFKVLMAAVVALSLGTLTGCNSGFSDDDIERIKTDIKAEFNKQPGVSVTEVVMTKDADNNKKLTGHVKANVSGPLGGTVELKKPCHATLDGTEIQWKCE